MQRGTEEKIENSSLFMPIFGEKDSATQYSPYSVIDALAVVFQTAGPYK